MTLNAHHSKIFESANKILADNYELSKSEDDCLRDGIYFFSEDK